MKKSILILTPFYKPFVGGAETFVCEITNRLANDFDFIILTARTDRALPNKELINSVTVYRLGWGWQYDKLLFPFLALIKSFFLPFDLSYAVMASYAGAAALLIKFLRGKPYVLNLQSGTMDTPDYQKIIWWFLPFYKKIHTSAAVVHVISDYLKNRALSLGVAENKIKIIPNGIDLAKFQFLNIKRDPWRVISVARLEKVKGVKYLIEAMPQVWEKFPQAELLIAGDGSQKSGLENLTEQLGIAGSVNFLGMVNHEQLPTLLNSGSIFICPSLAEGQGIAILEAMACGLAVVGTNVGGIPDLIRDKFNGLLVNPANPMALAEAINFLLENFDFRNELITNSQPLIKKYDWSNLAKEIKLLINDVNDV